ncbi:MAG: fibronectin type III domain-containing protein, partial [Geobacteraceae bacterium]|nr:fibronectin type III domain-containing protein [Geobacteraceae bacterium]
LQQIDVAFYQSKKRNSNRIYMWDHFVEPGVGYRYRIVPVTEKEQAGAVATIHRPCFRAPPPPTALNARASDRQVILSWKAPALGDKEQGKLVGYNIYRSKAGDYFSARPLNREPIHANTYEDLNLDNHATYRYTVRSVIKEGEFILESVALPAVQATPAPPQ